MASGVVYDENELDRVKDWVSKQQTELSAFEKEKNLKEWVVIGGIAVVATIVLLVVVKKIK